MANVITPKLIDGDFVPHRRDTIDTIEVGQSGLLFNEAKSEWQTLNPTAMILWQCFDGTGTIDEIVADLADAFGADASEVKDQVMDTVRRFGKQELLAGVEPDLTFRQRVENERSTASQDVVEDERPPSAPEEVDEESPLFITVPDSG